jgi:menaquinone-specific isochorismate synthase
MILDAEATVETAGAELARLVRAARHVRADGAYACVHVGAPAASPLAWLAAQRGLPRLFWHARGEGEATALLGAALTIGTEPHAPADLPPHAYVRTDSSLDALPDVLDRLGPRARLWGGLRFDPLTPPDGAWTLYQPLRFTLPRFAYTHHADGSATLACALVLPDDLSRLDAIARHAEALRPPRPMERVRLPLPLERADLPMRPTWDRMVNAALSAFGRGQLEKVVLARRVTYRFPHALDPFDLLFQLMDATPGCFHFFTEHAEGTAFVGASPERLFRMSGGRIETEAIAGTRPRGEAGEADDALRRELMESDKDRREHLYVLRFLREHLAQFATDVEADDSPREMPLARGRHLRSRLGGRLRAGVSPVDVLRALHPTPAVGGTPTAEAKAFLREHEPFDRGRYAAPLGWIGRDEAEFAVGIRSGRVEGDTLALYSGAGIVQGSDPQAEWDEIEGKIANFTSVLGLSAPH